MQPEGSKALSTFDTLGYVVRLQQAGVSVGQAEVQAEVFTEAFKVNLDNLLSKDYLAVRFAQQDARFEVRFNRLEARLGAKIDASQRAFVWTQASVMTAVVLPWLERLLAL
jgi:hypothetical protein